MQALRDGELQAIAASNLQLGESVGGEPPARRARRCIEFWDLSDCFLAGFCFGFVAVQLVAWITSSDWSTKARR